MFSVSNVKWKFINFIKKKKQLLKAFKIEAIKNRLVNKIINEWSDFLMFSLLVDPRFLVKNLRPSIGVNVFYERLLSLRDENGKLVNKSTGLVNYPF